MPRIRVVSTELVMKNGALLDAIHPFLTMSAIDASRSYGDVFRHLSDVLENLEFRTIVYTPVSRLDGKTSNADVTLKKLFGHTNIEEADIVERAAHSDIGKRRAAVSEARYWNDSCQSLAYLDSNVDTPWKIQRHRQLSGLFVPVLGMDYTRSIFGLVTREYGKTYTPEEFHALVCLCQTAHQSICKLKNEQLEQLAALSKRELQVLQLIADGKSNNEIADMVQISPHTVGTYIRRIFSKTKTTDRLSATLHGIRHGLVYL